MEGDLAAQEQAWAQIHSHLRLLAQSQIAREKNQICAPTELVHEAFFKLEKLNLKPKDRRHFFGLAANAMRQVLVDQARARNREKRGAGQPDLTLDTSMLVGHQSQSVSILDLDRAISTLQSLDARKAQVIELRYFGGMTDEEVARHLDISTATVKRDLRTARAWLAMHLDEQP